MHEKTAGHKDYETACQNVARKVKVLSQTSSVHNDEVRKNDRHIYCKTNPDNEASGEVAEIIVKCDYAVFMNVQN